MKIGLSFSRCVRDIFDNKVDIDDVLVIISRTNFDPRDDAQWTGIWRGYGAGNDNDPTSILWSSLEWSAYTDSDESRFRAISTELFETGKLFQPRKYGAYGISRPEYWLEAVLPDSELDRNPEVKDAWEKFQILSGLYNVKLDKNYTR